VYAEGKMGVKFRQLEKKEKVLKVLGVTFRTFKKKG
jgi:hypothetical protein